MIYFLLTKWSAIKGKEVSVLKKPFLSSREKKSLWIKLLFSAVITLIVAAIRGIFKVEKDWNTVFRFLSDGTVFAAVVMGSVGLLGWIISDGTFDAFAFSFRKTNGKHSEESFSEYSGRKASERSFRPKTFLIACAIMLVITLLMIFLYYVV